MTTILDKTFYRRFRYRRYFNIAFGILCAVAALSFFFTGNILAGTWAFVAVFGQVSVYFLMDELKLYARYAPWIDHDEIH